MVHEFYHHSVESRYWLCDGLDGLKLLTSSLRDKNINDQTQW